MIITAGRSKSNPAGQSRGRDSRHAQAGWQHDGSSPSLSRLSYGNCFVTAGIVVRLPFCSRAVCLPVLARLHLPGKGNGPGKVEMAAALVSQLAAAFPERTVHVVADAAYHGPA